MLNPQQKDKLTFLIRQIWKVIDWLNWRWVLIFVIVLGASVTFLELVEDIWLEEGFSWDVPLMRAIHELSNPVLDVVFKGVTSTAMSFIFVPIAIICYWLWKRRKHYEIALLIFSVIGMTIITTVLKFLFQRARPEVFEPLVTATSYSFPSGHTGSAVALFGLASIFLWRDDHHYLAIFCWVWVFLVMLSRVYLGAHYPTDVLASLMLGLIWITVLSESPFRKAQKRTDNEVNQA